jgi:hypothetical protein
MAPRKKPAVEQPSAAVVERFEPAALIKEHLTLKAYVEGEQKRLAEFLKPAVERMQACKSQLHAKALEQHVNGFPTDEGTAYLSEIINHAIDPESSYTTADGRQSFGRDALLDWMLEHWDEYGSEGMLLGITKPIVEKWRDATKSEQQPNGVPPPGLKLTTELRLNIRKS